MSDLENRLRSALHQETIEVSARSTLAEDMVARGSRVRRRRRVAGGVAALALVAVAVPIWHTIDTSSSPLPPTKQTPTAITQLSPTPSTPTTPTTPSTALPPYGTGPVSVDHQPSGAPQLVDVRAGEHPTYDRLVIDLTGGITGYDVTYVPKMSYPDPAGGQRLQLQDEAFLSVRLYPAVAHDSLGGSVLAGLQNYGMPSLREGVISEDFEGYVTLGFGLSKQAGFRVFELTSPTRLVIDVRH